MILDYVGSNPINYPYLCLFLTHKIKLYGFLFNQLVNMKETPLDIYGDNVSVSQLECENANIDKKILEIQEQIKCFSSPLKEQIKELRTRKSNILELIFNTTVNS